LVTATKCIITVFWLPKPVRTIIKLNYITTPITNDALDDSILALASLTLSPDDKTPLVSHDLDVGCLSWEKCNDEMSLKRILQSLKIEDKFIPEFVPLMDVVQPFTNKSAAACYEYTNTTHDCSKTSLDTCQRCQISIDKWSPPAKEVCATCPSSSAGWNMVVRESLFILNNRTRLIDRAQIICQLPGCNSVNNGNEVFRASNISFDFGEFFKN
jgi:hypothetical protein